MVVSVVANFFGFVALFLPFFPDDAGSTILGKSAGNMSYIVYFSVLGLVYLLYIVVFIKIFSKIIPNSKLKLFLIALPFMSILVSMLLSVLRSLLAILLVGLINVISFVQHLF